MADMPLFATLLNAPVNQCEVVLDSEQREAIASWIDKAFGVKTSLPGWIRDKRSRVVAHRDGKAWKWRCDQVPDCGGSSTGPIPFKA